MSAGVAQPDGNAVHLLLPLAGWSAWAANAQTPAEWTEWAQGNRSLAAQGTARSAFIPPMLRRRLEPFERMALEAGHACSADLPGVSTVFASRHGNFHRIMELLQTMSRGEEVSPASFSLSVLNATFGVASIAQGNDAPVIALGAADESFGYGVLEALGQCQADPGRPVLLVFADEPVTDTYRVFVHQHEQAHALALLFDARTPGTLALEWSARSADAPDRQMQSLAFLRFLLGEAPEITWQGSRHAWTWRHEKMRD